MKTPTAPRGMSIEAQPPPLVTDAGVDHGSSPSVGPSIREAPMRWLAYFAVLTVALFTIVLLVLWATGSFEGADLSASGWVALFLGITLTAALGIALMALVFYSDRQDVDDRAYHAASSDLAPGKRRPTLPNDTDLSSLGEEADDTSGRHREDRKDR